MAFQAILYSTERLLSDKLTPITGKLPLDNIPVRGATINLEVSGTNRLFRVAGTYFYNINRRTHDQSMAEIRLYEISLPNDVTYDKPHILEIYVEDKMAGYQRINIRVEDMNENLDIVAMPVEFDFLEINGSSYYIVSVDQPLNGYKKVEVKEKSKKGFYNNGFG